MILSAVILSQEKGKWRVVTEEGRQMRITASRIAHRAGRAAAEPDAAARAAADHSREAAARAAAVDVASLWELLVDGGGRHSSGSLASLALGEESPAAASAVMRRLSAEKTYFNRKGDDWVARSRQAVEETQRRVRTEAERSRRRNGFLDRMRGRMAAGAGEVPQ